VDAILAGNIHVDEVAYPERARHSIQLTATERFWVQDHVAMMGQGTRWDRKNEHLGREDAAVILMRRLWERELDKLAKGLPLKDWRRAPDVIPGVLALPYALR
jgi:hypothetical protein